MKSFTISLFIFFLSGLICSPVFSDTVWNPDEKKCSTFRMVDQNVTGFSDLFTFNTLSTLTGYSGLFAFNTQIPQTITGFSNPFTFNTVEPGIAGYSGLFTFNTRFSEILTGFSGSFLFNTQGILEYNLIVSIQPEGAGEVSGAGAFNYDEAVILLAQANEGYAFLNWADESGNELSVNPEYSFSMPAADVNLVARFQQENSVADISESEILVYPNPARDNLYVESGQLIKRIIITDVSGKVINEARFNSTLAEISTSAYREGLYIIRVYCENNVFTKNLVIIK